jgi:hypothetical protein
MEELELKVKFLEFTFANGVRAETVAVVRPFKMDRIRTQERH